MKRLLTAAAFVLLATSAHASPTMPREFQGDWCSISDEDAGPNVRICGGTCHAAVDAFSVKPTEFWFHEGTCTVAHVQPARNGRHHVTLACLNNNDPPDVEIVHWWMRIYQGALYMQRVDSSFTRPQG